MNDSNTVILNKINFSFRYLAVHVFALFWKQSMIMRLMLYERYLMSYEVCTALDWNKINLSILSNAGNQDRVPKMIKGY